MADWTREELVIICAELKANDWKVYRANSPEAERLSALLIDANFVPLSERDDDFRSPNSVQRKMYDLSTLLPTYGGKPTKGGRPTREVLQAFLDRPDKMDTLATSLAAAIEAGRTPKDAAVDVDWDSDADSLSDDFEAQEGGQWLAQHYRRERNRTIRKRKIAAVQAAGLLIACEVCEFDFGRAYGDLGDGYIEVHHVLPLHASGPTTTRLSDLALLCSNCHRMIHRARPWLTPEELRDRRGTTVATASN
ncbi:HNH endonuclease [Nocardioides sp. zg-1308]|uniref:HNH endonuclease n=1 Tax=Nocardioides sp. zg-1308 TaxID=2736253 RepID=UPI001554548D|nr:HNH endonuclease [Nocardioides sp. zg-1308]